MKTDIEIAQSCPLLPITAIGAKLGLTEEQLDNVFHTELYQ